MRLVAQIQDALAIWDGSPMPPRVPLWLKVKASLCIALGLEERDWVRAYDHSAPVWMSAPVNYHDWDGPGQRWSEVAVDCRPFRWRYSHYENGF